MSTFSASKPLFAMRANDVVGAMRHRGGDDLHLATCRLLELLRHLGANVARHVVEVVDQHDEVGACELLDDLLETTAGLSLGADVAPRVGGADVAGGLAARDDHVGLGLRADARAGLELP
jgi:hypothetical protein